MIGRRLQGFGVMLAALVGLCGSSKGDAPLWELGKLDGGSAEFALGSGGYARFLERFGRVDRAFYVGLMDPKVDWPAILPGPRDAWAGSYVSGDTRWDQQNTLPIGFVLRDASKTGTATLRVAVLDAHSQAPPRLRVTVNKVAFDRDLSPGGGDGSLRGDFSRAKPRVVEVEFPINLLRAGYNEVALRSLSGSWLIFDSIRLDAPEGTALAPVSTTVVRSIAAAPYARLLDPKTPATVQVEVFRAGEAGTVEVEVGPDRRERFNTQPGLQIFEVASAAGSTSVRVFEGDRLLAESSLDLAASPPAAPSDDVDVFRGTAHSRWMIAPGPWMPFGMVKLAPDNQPQGWVAGYDHGIEAIDCFSHIHEWTMAGLGMMPTLGELRTAPGLGGSGYSSKIDKATEHGGVGFYEVMLRDTGIKVELAATTRAGLQRYTFPANDRARVVFDFLLPNEYAMTVKSAWVRRVGPGELEGTISTEFADLSYNGSQDYDLHFVAQFSRPFDRMGGWEGARITPDAKDLAASGDSGAFVEFASKEGEAVLVRTGISLVGVGNARDNLERELARPFGWDFASVVSNQRRAWDDILARVQIKTPDLRERRRFYSNLYRAFAGRNTWSDANGDWLDPEERKRTLVNSDARMIGGDASWCTFWNLNPLLNLVAPDWSSRWANAHLALFDAGGWLAKGSPGLEYVSVMVAEHEIPQLVAACLSGATGVDAGKVLDAAIKMQSTLPQAHPGGGWVGNENLENYLKYGYVASDGPVVGQGTKSEWRSALTSNTFEYAYDDWCVGQLASKLGRPEVARRFLDRSESWRKVFDPASGFARPRKADGSWVEPFDPFHTPGFVEGNAWQYTWFVPQDVEGLVAAMGRDRFVDRLDGAFRRSEATRFNAAGERMDLFPINHGNQPTMQAAWLFNWADRPWLTQRWVRAILEAYYGHNPADAYLGDEDQGQMSAWFVLASLGLFQTDGGCRVDPIYELAAPLYPEITIQVGEGKTFRVEAPAASRANCYIQSAKLDGQPLDRWWLRRDEITRGGTLTLELGPRPNEAWARGCPSPPH